MNITGNKVLNASAEKVWAALHDAEILQKSISGCESMQWVSDNELTAELTAKIGPVKTKFKMKLTIRNAVENKGCTLECTADSIALGNADGQADITLSEVEQGCELGYTAQVKMRGKIAQFGARLLSPASKKMIDGFFTEFANNLQTQS